MLQQHRRLLDEQSGDGGNGNGGGTEDKTAEELQALATRMDGVVQQLSTLSTGFGSVQELLDSLKQDKGTDKGSAEKDPLTSVDLDTLSQSDLAAIIMNAVGKKVEDLLKPVLEGGQALGTKVQQLELEKLVDKTAEKYKNDHFWEWKAEIRAELERNPALSPEDAFLLAKVKNPNKVTELDKKHNPNGTDEAKKPSKFEDFFGGFRPVSSQTVKSRKMAQDEAATAAWDAVSAKYGISP